MRICAILLLAFLLDCLLGDPHYGWHPVCLIGRLIAFLEKGLRRLLPKNPRGELAGGVLLAVLVMAVSVIAPWALLALAVKINGWLAFVLETFMCYQLLAARALRDESMKVYEGLHRKDVEGARRAVSMIVGRDTTRLDEAGIARAAVETVAENASDGVMAPLLFMAVGGAPLYCH